MNTPNIDYSTIPPLACDIVHDVTLLPAEGKIHGLAGEAVYALGAYAEGKALAQVHRHARHVSTKQLPETEPQEVFAEPAIYGGIFFTSFGHFLCETLQRLWYAKKNPQLPIVWVGGHVTNAQVFSVPWSLKKIFSYLNIKNTHIFIQKPTLFKALHIPQPGFFLNRYLHPQHAEAFAQQEYPIQKGKYLYLSRANHRGCDNERAIETMLKKLGWQIYYPEKLSIKEQVKILSSAEVCLMIAGSAQHTLLFSKNPQTRYVIIPRIHSRTYQTIAQLKSQNYYLLHMPFNVVDSGKSKASVTFSLDVQKLQAVVKRTENFTKLDQSDTAVTKLKEIPKVFFTLPKFYGTDPCTITMRDNIFYNAVYCYKKNELQQAYNLLSQLKKQNKLLPYMHERYMQVLLEYNAQYNANIALKEEENDLKILSLHNALKNRPKDSFARQELIIMLRRTHKIKRAFAQADTLKTQSPQWKAVDVQYAKLHEVMGDLPKAIGYAMAGTKGETKKHYNYIYLLTLHLKNNDDDQAMKVLLQAFEANADWKKKLIYTATKYFAWEMIEKDFVQNHILTKSECKALQKKFRQSQQQAKKSWIYTQKSALFQSALKYLALYNILKENYFTAEKIAQQSIFNNPTQSWAYHVLARVQKNSGHVYLALENIEKALELDPQNPAYQLFKHSLRGVL